MWKRALIGALIASPLLFLAGAPAFAASVFNKDGSGNNAYVGSYDFNNTDIYFTCINAPVRLALEVDRPGNWINTGVPTADGDDVYHVSWAGNTITGLVPEMPNTPPFLDCGTTMKLGNSKNDVLAPPAPIVAPITGSLIPMPTNFPAALSSNVSGQIADPGTLLVLGIAAGIPIAFYVFHELLNLLPGVRAHRKKYGEFG